ncbi:nitroreductase family protein [Pseudomonas helvetica]|uniref:nitroreductase family protein n=1 Tax=Pseudomonas helvetica TaxID=3136738 RepID=UPI0032642710
MTWIDLGNPTPKCLSTPYQPVDWATGAIQRLPAGSAMSTPPLLQVLEERRSVRDFAPLEDMGLANFLWYACRSHDTWASELGYELEYRASPSAGAIHPIHLIMKRPEDPRWWLYEPRGHFLAELTAAPLRLNGLWEQSQQVVSAPQATLILFLAEPGKTLAKYQNGCSLIWRDAGAQLATMALAARAMKLNFCPLGVTGEPWAGSLAEQGQLVGVGLALLGRAP